MIPAVIASWLLLHYMFLTSFNFLQKDCLITITAPAEITSKHCDISEASNNLGKASGLLCAFLEATMQSDFCRYVNGLAMHVYHHKHVFAAYVLGHLLMVVEWML
jgi:hypothetical protein